MKSSGLLFVVLNDSILEKELQTQVKNTFMEKAQKVIKLVLNKKLFTRLFKIAPLKIYFQNFSLKKTLT